MRACPTPGTGLKSGGSEVLGLPVGCLAGMPHAAGPCSGAGMVILRMLETAGLSGHLIVVTRWYGGKHLGGDRFRHVQEAVRLYLAEIGA